MTKVSEQEEIRARINRRLIDEQTTYVKKENSPDGNEYREVQVGLLQDVKDAGQTGNPAFILSIEKDLLEKELNAYHGSPGTKASLKAAIKDMTAAERLVATVQDPATYKTVDEAHDRPRSRTRGVPRDEARKSISAQYTRLLNVDKSRMTKTERQTVKARRSNLLQAEKLYTAMQHQALGKRPPEKSRKRGLER